MSRLRINLLGSPEVYVNGSYIDFKRRKEVALLAYLSVERRPHSRDSLSDLLYPNQDRRRARGNFRVNLLWLRSKLGPEIVRTDSNTVSLAEDTIATDVDELERLVDDTSNPADRMRRMMALYRGDFLESFYLDSGVRFEEWQLANQDRLRSLYATFLDNVAVKLRGLEASGAALQAYSELLTLDPSDEEVHRAIMEIHAEAGRLGLAIRQFQRCQEIMARELDAEPAEETVLFYRELTLRERAKAPTRLPKYLDSFVGRSRELDKVLRMIDVEGVRLVSIVGGPGIGKTRLAVRAAQQLGEKFPHGRIHVDLTQSSDSGDVPQLIAQSLGIRDSAQGRFGAIEMVERALIDRKMLLLLDGFEVVLDAAPQLSRLLDSCSKVIAIVTSRESLGVRHERLLRLGPLSVYTEAGSIPEAVELFVDRCRESRRELDESETRTATAICDRLEGVPLAIELAAARLDVLSVAELYQRIGRVLTLLSVERATQCSRHRTLRGAIDWSYQLLSEEERAAFEALSLCPSGVTMGLAEVVLASSAVEPLDLINSLVRKCLVTRVEHDGESRFVMLNSTRAFGREMLLSRDRLLTVRDRIIEYYMGLSARAAVELRSSDQIRWLERLEL